MILSVYLDNASVLSSMPLKYIKIDKVLLYLFSAVEMKIRFSNGGDIITITSVIWPQLHFAEYSHHVKG